jgi:hypothetical protein
MERFASANLAEVVSALTLNSEFAVEEEQRDAWRDQVGILQDTLRGMPGTLFVEYVVPRLGSRIDAVLILGPALIVIEFKMRKEVSVAAAVNQVWDYALDLRRLIRRGTRSITTRP